MDQEQLQVILCDRQRELVRAWRRSFRAHPEVAVRHGDLLTVAADAYVSPANSCGWMDGGLDLLLRERFVAGDIQGTVHEAIAAKGGRLPVGRALVVGTDDDEVPYLVVAPTMEVPCEVGHTVNAYRAMRALLRAVQRFNARGEGHIGSVAVPGLCTGVGGMEPSVAALQMRRAYRRWLRGPG
jgi:O-acetyl-ADP-ribose deacetylase (regulator of RNase III)